MNKKRNRRKRPSGDLAKELNEQIALLVHACESFDKGFEPIGKHIALSLRKFLYDHGQSKALLRLVGLRSKRFLDTAGDLNPGNVLTDCALTAMRLGGDNKYIPYCRVGSSPAGERWITFERWWNNNVVKDNNGRFFNRRDLILEVADTDGGAHVDEELDAAYLDLSRNNSLGWVLTRGDVQSPFPPPVMACIRQIAHEVLETLKKKGRPNVVVAYDV